MKPILLGVPLLPTQALLPRVPILDLRQASIGQASVDFAHLLLFRWPRLERVSVAKNWLHKEGREMKL